MGIIITIVIILIGVVFIAKNLDVLNSSLKDINNRELD